MADVAIASNCVMSYSSASSMHCSTAVRIASMPDFLIDPSSLTYCISRTMDLVLASGSGRAPGAASTISI